ncbi:hypothetical protein [Actinomadura rifamycini]|uniref:hypothetical protein n=1 Tax=Actinomadura rifamycini TaxID=31962 RepID=UPI0003F8F34A|nr:hypothetical protein [Actinomadura rifamycini]
MASVLFPTMRAALALPLSMLGMLIGLSKPTGVIFGPLWALVADHIGRKRTLVLCSGV